MSPIKQPVPCVSSIENDDGDFLRRDTKTRKQGAIAFLIVTFVGTWPIWLIQTKVLGMSLVDPRTQLFTAFVPAGAAIVVRKWITGEGFGDAAWKFRLPGAWPWYLLAWVGPIAITAATLLVAFTVGCWHFDLAPLNGMAILLPLLTLVLTPCYLGEEFGWTGYFRPRIFPGRPLTGAVVTGLVWAVWHYPLAFLGYIEFNDVAVGLAVWTGSFVLQQVALTWLYLKGKSVWVAALAHAGNNMIIGLVTGLLFIEHGSLDDVESMLFTAIPLGACCIAMVVSGGFRPDSSPTARIMAPPLLRETPQ